MTNNRPVYNSQFPYSPPTLGVSISRSFPNLRLERWRSTSIESGFAHSLLTSYSLPLRQNHHPVEFARFEHHCPFLSLPLHLVLAMRNREQEEETKNTSPMATGGIVCPP